LCQQQRESQDDETRSSEKGASDLPASFSPGCKLLVIRYLNHVQSGSKIPEKGKFKVSGLKRSQYSTFQTVHFRTVLSGRSSQNTWRWGFLPFPVSQGWRQLSQIQRPLNMGYIFAIEWV
jgi:hypothetical protein